MVHQKSIVKVMESLEPLIDAKARKYGYIARYDPSFAMDDAKQEARMFLLDALNYYDDEKEGTLTAFVSAVLDNMFIPMLSKMANQHQACSAYVNNSPSRYVCWSCGKKMLKNKGAWFCMNDGNGKDKDKCDQYLVRVNAVKLNTMGEDVLHKVIHNFGVAGNPCEHLIKLQNYNLLVKFEKQLVEEMTDRERDVYFSLFDIGDLFTKDRLTGILNGSKRTIQEASRELGLSMNQVSWAIHAIKRHFTKLARKEEFISLYGDSVNSKRWPIIYTSRKGRRDEKLISKTVSKMSLDEVVLDRTCERNGAYYRDIDFYSWGVVMFIKRGNDCCTLVLVGHFDVIQGFLFGDIGTIERIPVEWYGSLVAQLRKAKNGR